MKIHFQYFIGNQEKLLSVVIVICLVMAVALIVFFSYHMRLLWNN
jgi:cell division protein FtsL